MKGEYLSLKNEGFGEYTEKKSVFYGYSAPVATEEEAISFVKKIKEKHSDARHNVYAYMLRENNAQRFSDDGEPHGTAGLPLLDTLRKPCITDAVIVVTRYFGGILLGTGGLVRAYSTAASEAVKNSQIVTYTLFRKMKITVSYSDYQKIIYFLDKREIAHTPATFDANVSLVANILPENWDGIISNLLDTTGGKAIVEDEGTEYCAKS
jgi:uncharacterized YigZ family protein